MKAAARKLSRRLADCRRLVTLGHYALVPVAGTVVAMRVVAAITGSYLACYAVSVPLVVLLPALAAHGVGMCTRGTCALISANPGEEAVRRAWWLRHVHAALRSRLTWALLVAWFVLTFVLAWPVASAIPIIVGLVVEVRALRLHSALRPWCPECGHGGIKLYAAAR